MPVFRLNRSWVGAACAAAVLLAWACQPQRGAAVPGTRACLALTRATVIDPLLGPLTERTVVIERQQIVAITPAQAPSAGCAQVHDAQGKFVIAGLWDAHVHLSQVGSAAFALLVANGVTSVRDMGSDLTEIKRWKAERDAGALIPRIVSSGPKLDGEGDPWNDTKIVTDPEQARVLVSQLKAEGADFIKVHEGLTPAVYAAIRQQCLATGLSFAGHTTPLIPPLVAAGAGQRSIEHGHGLFPCSAAERESFLANPETARTAAWCVNPQGLDAVLAELARAGTWFTPTRISWQGQLLGSDTEPATIQRLFGGKYVYPALLKHWQSMSGSPASAPRRLLIPRLAEVVERAHRFGVRLLAGSDLGDPYVIPGFALHEELSLLSAAKIPPLAVLRSATVETAAAVGMANRVGRIEVGQAADLVLLSANPLLDIANTRKIEAVVINGRYLSRADLDALLAQHASTQPAAARTQ